MKHYRMKQIVHLIYICAVLLLTGCGDGKSVRQLPHIGNTPYQQDTILMTYATNPERALTLLGNGGSIPCSASTSANAKNTPSKA